MTAAVEKADWDDLKNPGDYIFTGRYQKEGTYGMIFCCPCGCGSLGSLAFDNDTDEGRPRWHWNGSRDKPTLTPSIQKTDGCRWHGYLTDGVFTKC